MSTQDDDPEVRVVGFVLMMAVVLALGLAIGVAVFKARGGNHRTAGPAAVALVGGSASAADAAPAMPAVGGAATAVDATTQADSATQTANTAAPGADAGAPSTWPAPPPVDAAPAPAASAPAMAAASEPATVAAADAAVSAPAASPVPTPAAEDASVVVENGVVKFYFASSKAALAPGALAALADAIAASKAGKRLVISGFHDATGGAALNAELAKKRAVAVRDALLGAGVDGSLLELKKPEQTQGTGNKAEARRVEVMVVQ